MGKKPGSAAITAKRDRDMRSKSNRNETALMLQLWLDHGLANFGAAVGAFKGEVDLRHAPMRLDIPYKHRNPDAARTNDESRLDVVVMVDIGWHVGTPHGSIQL
ncbi:hypothetical protein JQ629_02155 [Bradyrhizobium sp. AUGA SZCCT0222]|nr:hypothetical protein [Bradyrhizobium sp. AUGA SZCCT0222]